MMIATVNTELDPYYLMGLSKDQLVKYARKVQKALPGEGVIASGRKADIAFSIVAAIKNNPE